MSAELLHLYKELYKPELIFIGTQKTQNSILSLSITQELAWEMDLECQKSEDNFCCIILGQRTCSSHCRKQNCFCASCQLYNIEEKTPAVICQNCNFLSECYTYKHLSKGNRRDSYILLRHCIDHCELDNCPHRDEATVELNRLILRPNYCNFLYNGSSQEMVDIHQQGASAQQLKGREAPIPSSKNYPTMVSGISKKNRSGPKGLVATKRASRARGGRRWSRGSPDDRIEPRLSSKTII